MPPCFLSTQALYCPRMLLYRPLECVCLRINADQLVVLLLFLHLIMAANTVAQFAPIVTGCKAVRPAKSNLASVVAPRPHPAKVRSFGDIWLALLRSSSPMRYMWLLTPCMQRAVTVCVQAPVRTVETSKQGKWLQTALNMLAPTCDVPCMRISGHETWLCCAVAQFRPAAVPAGP